MKKIKWGIIGCGDVTELKSGPAFNKVANSALVAVMRRDAAKARDYAHRHQVPAWYDDAAKLIHDPNVDAVYIATPPSSHAAYCIDVINAGKPVYVEKPMALNYREAKNMAGLASEKNVKLVVAHYRREQPIFKKIKQLIDENYIGDISLVHLEFYRPALTKEELTVEKTTWRVDPEIAGGGLFHDLAPHQLDLMYYFFGPVQKAAGIAVNQSGLYAADDTVTGNILFKNGIVFHGAWSFNAPAAFNKDHCEITGSKGKISFSVFNHTAFSVTMNNVTTVFNFDPLLHVQQPMIEKTVQYFLGNTENPCSGADGAEVMRLIDAFAGK